MSVINNKIIVVGVSGGIAAYKACDLVRKLILNGADVSVVMTKNACQFVTPLTFQTLSNNKVSVDLFDWCYVFLYEEYRVRSTCHQEGLGGLPG